MFEKIYSTLKLCLFIFYGSRLFRTVRVKRSENSVTFFPISLIFVIVTRMWYFSSCHAVSVDLGWPHKPHRAYPGSSCLTKVIKTASHGLIPAIKLNNLVWVPLQNFRHQLFLIVELTKVFSTNVEVN